MSDPRLQRLTSAENTAIGLATVIAAVTMSAPFMWPLVGSARPKPSHPVLWASRRRCSVVPPTTVVYAVYPMVASKTLEDQLASRVGHPGGGGGGDTLGAGAGVDPPPPDAAALTVIVWIRTWLP